MENQIANFSGVSLEFQSGMPHFVPHKRSLGSAGHVSAGIRYRHGLSCSLVMGLPSWAMPGQGSTAETGWLEGGGLGGHFIKAHHAPKSPFGAALPECRGRKHWEVEGWQRPGSEPPQER